MSLIKRSTYWMIDTYVNGKRVRQSLGSNYQIAKIKSDKLIEELELNQSNNDAIKNSQFGYSLNTCIDEFMGCEYAFTDKSQLKLPIIVPISVPRISMYNSAILYYTLACALKVT